MHTNFCLRNTLLLAHAVGADLLLAGGRALTLYPQTVMQMHLAVPKVPLLFLDV